jgi:LruC domain-containing protein
MKNTNLLLMMFFVVLAFTACKKDVNDPNSNQPGSMNDLVISDDFNWETFKDIDVTISITGAKDYQAKSKVSVFNADPASGGKLMVSGNAAPGSSFASSMRIPSYLTQLYLKMESPFTGNQTVTVPVSGNAVNYTFDSQKSGDDLKSVIVEPACGEDDDIIVTQTSGTLTITGGAIYSLAGVFNGSINFTNSGGTLKVCGTVTATNNVQMNKSTHHLIVTQNGSFQCDDLSLTHSDATVSVYSNSLLDLNGNFSPKGFVKNYGTIDVEESWENSSGGYFENYGTILVGKDMKLNTSTQNINACKIIVQDKFHQNSPGCTFIMEYGSYLETGDDAEFTKDHTIMYESSMIKCPKFFINSSADFTVYGDALVLVSEEINIDGDINGPLTVAYEAGVNPDVSGSLTNGANVTPVANVTTYLPISACNPVGFGTPPIIDTDLDGVPDELDLYPTDNQRAANSYFPAQDVWGTVAFEDLWPSKGDYDFNDLVLDYTGYYVLNGENDVKDLIVKFEVRAVGASFNNGFGFQLDQIDWDEVESVTGFVHESEEMPILLNANGTEADQPKAVIIAVSTVESVINRASGSMFNTIQANPTGTWDLTTITTTFANAVPQSKVGMEDFNPFLIKDQNRDIEVHLPNMVPTAQADISLLGTEQDNSIPGEGRYYKTKTNLPWGILMFERFDYPIETVEIIDAYLHFAEWAQSGGVSYPDWYTDQSGYRVPANIY